VPETVALGRLRRFQRAHHHRLQHHRARVRRRRLPGILVHQPREQRLVERTPVNANPHGTVILHRGFDHRAEVVVVLPPDIHVARIDSVLRQRAGALGIFLQQDVAVVMKIADDGNADAGAVQFLDDARHRLRGLVIVDRDAHQFRASARQGGGLVHRALDIRGIRVRHRLHDDRMARPDSNSAYIDHNRAAPRQDRH